MSALFANCSIGSALPWCWPKSSTTTSANIKPRCAHTTARDRVRRYAPYVSLALVVILVISGALCVRRYQPLESGKRRQRGHQLARSAGRTGHRRLHRSHGLDGTGGHLHPERDRVPRQSWINPHHDRQGRVTVWWVARRRTSRHSLQLWAVRGLGREVPRLHARSSPDRSRVHPSRRNLSIQRRLGARMARRQSPDVTLWLSPLGRDRHPALRAPGQAQLSPSNWVSPYARAASKVIVVPVRALLTGHPAFAASAAATNPALSKPSTSPRT